MGRARIEAKIKNIIKRSRVDFECLMTIIVLAYVLIKSKQLRRNTLVLVGRACSKEEAKCVDCGGVHGLKLGAYII